MDQYQLINGKWYFWNGDRWIPSRPPDYVIDTGVEQRLQTYSGFDWTGGFGNPYGNLPGGGGNIPPPVEESRNQPPPPATAAEEEEEKKKKRRKLPILTDGDLEDLLFLKALYSGKQLESAVLSLLARRLA